MEKMLKKLNRPWTIFSIVLGLLILVLIIMIIIYDGELDPDHEALVEEYAKFLGGIVSTIFGFYLVNVVWGWRMREYQMDRFKKIAAHFFLKINTCCKQIKKLLVEDYSSEEKEASLQRDHQIQEIMQKLHWLGQGIENYTPEIDLIEDEVIRDVAVSIWADIQMNLERLPMQQDFRIDVDEFKETINALIDSTARAIAPLRSQNR